MAWHRTLKNALMAIALGFLVGGLVLSSTIGAQADVVRLRGDDPAMVKAIQSAQGSFDRILEKTMSPRGFTAAGLSVKVAVPVPGPSLEHIWVTKIKATNNGWKGTLINQPVHFNGRLGGPLRFVKSQVTDWSYNHNGTLYGEFTTRAILPHLSNAEAAAIRKSLSRKPIPNGW